MNRPRRKFSAGRVTIVVMLLGSLTILAAGCAQASNPAAPGSSPAAAKTDSSMMVGSDVRPDVPACYECSGKGTPPVAEGTAVIESGMQVVNIKIENGYYVPNKITVKAGMPVKVVFTGQAKDCVGKPKFGSLNKQIDIRQTGSGAIELGALSAGTYAFTCGMGVNAGSIIVQ